MSSLRNTILHHAIPLISTHSFTRQALLQSLPSLKPDHPDYRPVLEESVVDTIFGNGQAPGKALTAAWEEEGLKAMQGENTRERLKSRLGHSAVVGEHLVEAYALLSAPTSTPSLPLPTIPKPVLALISQMRFPTPYSPPHSPMSTSTPPPAPVTPNPAADFESAMRSTSNRLSLIGFNPVGSLSYAWRIADHALRPMNKARGVQKGLMEEPTGSGPEWYSSRISLMMAYLIAESRLLQPITVPNGGINPHIVAAEAALDDHLNRYDIAASVVEGGGKNTGYLMNYLGHLGNSAIGLIRSRGF